jgi:hypothetical protein
MDLADTPSMGESTLKMIESEGTSPVLLQLKIGEKTFPITRESLKTFSEHFQDDLSEKTTFDGFIEMTVLNVITRINQARIMEEKGRIRDYRNYDIEDSALRQFIDTGLVVYLRDSRGAHMLNEAGVSFDDYIQQFPPDMDEEQNNRKNQQFKLWRGSIAAMFVSRANEIDAGLDSLLIKVKEEIYSKLHDEKYMREHIETKVSD